jgi:hypothetical protein
MKKNIEKSEAPDQQADDVGAGQRAYAEDRERHQGLGRAQLDRDEDGEQRQRERDQAQRLHRSPARSRMRSTRA